MSYAAFDTKIDDGRAGFTVSNTGGAFLDNWADRQSVTIRLGTASARPFDTISLEGARAAIATLRSCAQGSGSAAATARPLPRAVSASTAGVSRGGWWSPPANPMSVGIVSGSGDMTFRLFYAKCDPVSKSVWLTRTSMRRSPRETVLNFVIDGKPYGLMATSGEGEANDYYLGGDTYYGAPIVTALVNAKAVRITTDGVALNLPVAGMNAAMTSFRRACRL